VVYATRSATRPFDAACVVLRSNRVKSHGSRIVFLLITHCYIVSRAGMTIGQGGYFCRTRQIVAWVMAAVAWCGVLHPERGTDPVFADRPAHHPVTLDSSAGWRAAWPRCRSSG
jgi:hypothetical protein